jgi:hypothetical protein
MTSREFGLLIGLLNTEEYKSIHKTYDLSAGWLYLTNSKAIRKRIDLTWTYKGVVKRMDQILEFNKKHQTDYDPE